MTDVLAKTLQALPSPDVLVIGDLILDCYIEGSTSRVSVEAPVLIFETQQRRWLLGGACNVAANLVALRSTTGILGVVGEDAAGQQLLDLLRDEGVDTEKVVRDPSRPTIRKTRYVSRTAQILRVDEERRHPVSAEVEGRILEQLAQRPFPYRAVLLSDYGKGMLPRSVIAAAVEAAQSADAIVTVDPKGSDYSIYRGVDLLTPNREEAEVATGIPIRDLDDLPAVAAALRRLTGVRNVTITLGRDGIFYESEDGQSEVLPTEAKAVFDVTGAGDTVVAVLTLARSCGVPLRESLQLANLAAGIVVGHFGTWAVSREELLSALGRSDPGKILSRDQAMSVAARLRTEGRRLVFTNGCFDILHPGHTDYLAKARAYGDALMVAINTDESVHRQGKGDNRPINPLENRMAVLAALQDVDYVVPFDTDTPLPLIEATTPHVLVKGEDWRDRGVVGREWVESHGGQVVLVTLRPGCSTTGIIERILGGTREG
ncbi:MAG: bifunctional heptose 7-phosphate kinase/heptose 1-phosphate adenyltransferase [Planctomycetota bacterium]